MKVVRRAFSVALVGAFFASMTVTGLVVSAWPGGAAAVDCTTSAAIIPPNHYSVHHLDGTITNTFVLSNVAAPGTVRPGDTVFGTFQVNPDCATVVVSAASYWAPSAIFTDQNQMQQVLFDSSTTTVTTNGRPTTVTLSVKIPSQGIGFGQCPNKHNSSSMAFNGNGGSAASGNPYASTCDGRASQNGNGNGNANGKPCQGCVGNADNKNPHGQQPNGTDHNNGYECDGNNGVGKGNPAHSSCLPAHFQMEFVVGPVIQSFVVNGVYTPYPSNRFIQAGSTLG